MKSSLAVIAAFFVAFSLSACGTCAKKKQTASCCASTTKCKAN